MARVFSQKHSSTSVSNMGIYSVGRDSVYQIWQISKIECFAGISREGLICKTLVKTNCLHPVLTLRIPIMCWAHASLCEKPSWELPMKTSLVFNSFLSLHTPSFTYNPYKKSHIKYRVQKIKQNYNQIWHGIKANIK